VNGPFGVRGWLVNKSDPPVTLMRFMIMNQFDIFFARLIGLHLSGFISKVIFKMHRKAKQHYHTYLHL